MLKIIKYVLLDLIRSRVMAVYAGFLFVASMAFLRLDDSPVKALASLLNIVSIVVPLVSVVFSTVHFYSSSEFRELLLAQPLSRNRLIISELIGVALALTWAFALGVGIPILIFSPSWTGFWLIATGKFLTWIFTALGFLAAVVTRDKTRGIGTALLIWFFFALIYDGLVLAGLFAFSDWPLERSVVPLALLNPVDLGRILVLLEMDVAALLGLSGAVFREFFGSVWGMTVAMSALLVWAVGPMILAVRLFKKKDL